MIAALAALVAYPFDTLKVGPVENGWFESAQTFALGLTVLLSVEALLKARHEIFYFSATLVILLPLAMVRETPRCGSPFYDGGLCLTANGKALTVMIAIALVVALVAIRRVSFARSWRELTFFYAVPVAVTLSMLVGAEILGKLIYVWAEEIFELAAYLNLFGLALAVRMRPSWFSA
ncbi:DNA polymerase III subunit chi [Fulvimarina pelagi HTCC2506]|uniref:DNA polymerase III subunit chi n=2 Tax=Fulvimarina pelagi TaxID=217511 RepID=Q0G6N3_9HYPH|nr:DNA polymerase III subunit chi [Fulvimarina pelagi HTCC2506]